jgi:hypothetical protein
VGDGAAESDGDGVREGDSEGEGDAEPVTEGEGEGDAAITEAAGDATTGTAVPVCSPPQAAVEAATRARRTQRRPPKCLIKGRGR